MRLHQVVPQSPGVGKAEFRQLLGKREVLVAGVRRGPRTKDGHFRRCGLALLGPQDLEDHLGAPLVRNSPGKDQFHLVDVSKVILGLERRIVEGDSQTDKAEGLGGSQGGLPGLPRGLDKLEVLFVPPNRQPSE